MAPIITPISAIVAGKINIKLNVRVMNLWTVTDYNNADEETSIHMLLIDDKVSFSSNRKLIPFVDACVLLLLT